VSGLFTLDLLSPAFTSGTKIPAERLPAVTKSVTKNQSKKIS
jgi:hypothetical protein